MLLSSYLAQKLQCLFQNLEEIISKVEVILVNKPYTGKSNGIVFKINRNFTTYNLFYSRHEVGVEIRVIHNKENECLQLLDSCDELFRLHNQAIQKLFADRKEYEILLIHKLESDLELSKNLVTFSGLLKYNFLIQENYAELS
ncbi:hypothetical protein Sarmat_00101 [Rickettsiales endosymbiont of Paramecium tredecaurelia]|uniref:hypothetical protein n=1 Tax=Candidatus Sarmatiella mevalonica TaxID=2770581 RepID=UPI0019208E73|nr:hypothetical protein [Candidatus Sarmatiella mevalonica]MBL3284261.1 hypothetical protein [Candidatus Sarmatiella mevalonica]